MPAPQGLFGGLAVRSGLSGGRWVDGWLSPAGRQIGQVRSGHEQDLANVGARFEGAMRVGCPGHRKRVIDDRSDLTRGYERPYMLADRRYDLSLLACRTGAQRGGVHACAPVLQFAEVELGAASALAPDHHQAPACGQGLHVPCEVTGTHDVEDDIGARPGADALSETPDRLDEVLVTIGDSEVRAKLSAARQLLLGASGARHRRAMRTAKLDRHGADPARPAVYEQRLARPEAREHEHVRVYGAGHLRQPGGLDEADTSRYGKELPGWYRYFLRIAAPRQQGAYLVASLPSGHILAYHDDPARALQARKRRGAGRRRIETLALQRVGPVHPARRDSHEYL